MYNKSLFVITGGPGSGKSSIIKELKKQGYYTIEESGRKIIQEQVKTNGKALPWKDKKLFRDAMFNEDIVQYNELTYSPLLKQGGSSNSYFYKLSKALGIILQHPLHHL